MPVTGTLPAQTTVTDAAGIAARPCPWPNGAPFALFLSHDIDQIHDREMWRILADVNHIRRVAFEGERGNIGLALRRVGRALFRPKPAVKGFETMLGIEARYGFRSTFFVLDDHRGGRYRARYRLSDPELESIVKLVQEAGCEVAVHGAYFDLDDSEAYRRSREEIAQRFQTEPVGIRNHYLRHAGATTWEAQQKAGFLYDASFGSRDGPGPKDGRTCPFWGVEPSELAAGLVELPLSLMDVTLQYGLSCRNSDLIETAWNAVAPAIASGGLVSLLWHNNYFNEEEYAHLESIYEEMLSRLSKMGPWCATGREIAEWWRSQNMRTSAK